MTRIALYVHVPFCQSKCEYCGFYSVAIGKGDVRGLIEAELRELDGYKLKDPAGTIYIGGGSPSCLPRDQLLFLINQITQRLGTAEEFTIELNPSQITAGLLRSLYDVGVNRLSIGVQSFNQPELDFLNRPYTPDYVTEVIKQARRVGFDNINIDLIFAVPNSTLQSWQYSLEKAIELSVEHIAAYSLSYEPGTVLADKRTKGEITPITEELDRAMYLTAIDTLSKAGIEQYEISNFAKPNRRCKHNLTYWSNKPYIGIGPAAGSYWQGKRTTNTTDVNAYIEAVEQGRTPADECAVPTKKEIACETAVLMLRQTNGIDLAKFKTQTGYDAAKLFSTTIKYHQAAGMLTADKQNIKLTRQALPIADSIICDFSDIYS